MINATELKSITEIAVREQTEQRDTLLEETWAEFAEHFESRLLKSAKSGYSYCFIDIRDFADCFIKKATVRYPNDTIKKFCMKKFAELGLSIEGCNKFELTISWKNA